MDGCFIPVSAASCWDSEPVPAEIAARPDAPKFQRIPSCRAFDQGAPFPGVIGIPLPAGERCGVIFRRVFLFIHDLKGPLPDRRVFPRPAKNLSGQTIGAAVKESFRFGAFRQLYQPFMKFLEIHA